ncbi:MAG: hypothetical protein Q9221_001640 [Calogaya cf. arnoldii]
MPSSNAVLGLDATAAGADPANGSETESDDKSASVEDPDVFAPSDAAYNPSQSQTGLHTITPYRSETKAIADREASCSGANLVSFGEGATISDDDDYTGVDLISESGDEEPTIDSLEEKAPIDSEGDDADGARPRSPPNSPYDDFSFPSTGQIDFDLDPFLTDDIFFKEQINLLDHYEGSTGIDNFASANDFGFASPLAETPRRRVRFADPLMLPSEASKLVSTDFDNGGYSTTQFFDDTLNKNNEHTNTEHKSCDDQVGSGNEAMPSTARGRARNNLADIFEPMNSDDDQEDNDEDTDGSVGSSSGYETDQGSTTEEEDVPASATARPSAVLRDSSTVANYSSFTGQSLPQTPSTSYRSGRQWGPTLGSFVTNPTRPFAVVARDAKKLIIYPAQRPASRGNKVFPSILSSGQNSVQASPQTAIARMTAPPNSAATDDSELERSEISSQGMATPTPMLSDSPNLMISGLGLSNGNMLSGYATGPPEAFFPYQRVKADGTMILHGFDVGDDDVSSEEEAEDLLNIEDFINLGGDSEDSDQDAESNVQSALPSATSSPTQNAAKPASKTPSPTQSSFLNHLDMGMVTAFRRNQYDYEPNTFGQPSKSPFCTAGAIKANAFVASNTSIGSLGKRKLSDQEDDSPSYDHAFTKRPMPNLLSTTPATNS